jgi:hypothetical protein
MKLNDVYWVYQIECVPTKKLYIGLTGKPNPCWRWSDHYLELRRDVSKAPLLQAEWNRYPDLTQWSFRALFRVEGVKLGRTKEAEVFLATPKNLRLNSPNTLALNWQRREKIEDMLKQGVSYRTIVKATGVSLGLVAKIKSQNTQRAKS